MTEYTCRDCGYSWTKEGYETYVICPVCGSVHIIVVPYI